MKTASPACPFCDSTKMEGNHPTHPQTYLCIPCAEQWDISELQDDSAAINDARAEALRCLDL